MIITEPTLTLELELLPHNSGRDLADLDIPWEGWFICQDHDPYGTSLDQITPASDVDLWKEFDEHNIGKNISKQKS